MAFANNKFSQKITLPYCRAQAYPLTFCFWIMVKNYIDTLYHRFNEDFVGRDNINTWLDQFEIEDRSIALRLAELIDYWGYRRVHFGLQILHTKLKERLQHDGFIVNTDPEHCYDQIDFSRTFCSKSGDLVCYFYRKANGIRSLEFTNLEALESQKTDFSKCALVLLDDYVGTGCQFFSFSYRRDHHALFNRYAKVYLGTLVANKRAIDTFYQMNRGNFDPLVKILYRLDESDEIEQIKQIRKTFDVVKPRQVQLVSVSEEVSLLAPESHMGESEIIRVRSLLDKYISAPYCEGLFNIMSHSVFFFQCPNNVPQIFWDWDCRAPDKPWRPLFPRVSDSSIYTEEGEVPHSQQVFGKLWE